MCSPVMWVCTQQQVTADNGGISKPVDKGDLLRNYRGGSLLFFFSQKAHRGRWRSLVVRAFNGMLRLHALHLCCTCTSVMCKRETPLIQPDRCQIWIKDYGAWDCALTPFFLLNNVVLRASRNTLPFPRSDWHPQGTAIFTFSENSIFFLK